jgi:hypothetical protein
MAWILALQQLAKLLSVGQLFQTAPIFRAPGAPEALVNRI